MSQKTAFVTGAAGGIGEATARLLAAKGYKVALVDLDAERVKKTASTIEGAVSFAADTSKEADVEKAFEAFGHIPDVVVANAGIVRFGMLLDVPVEDYQRVTDINLVGVFITARAGAKRMQTRGSGSIINITSINGIGAGINSGAYPAAKAGVARMTEQMALEWGPLGIRVNAVAPGFIDGGMSTAVYADPKTRALRTGAVPLRRLGSVEDVARAIWFFACDESSYITGQQIAVDGGISPSVLAQLPRQ